MYDNLTFHFAKTPRFKLPFIAAVWNHGGEGGRMRMIWFEDQVTLGM